EFQTPISQSEPEAAPNKRVPPEGGAPKKLEIEWWEFQAALEGFESITGEEFRYYLDTQTGEVLTLFPDYPNYEQLEERINTEPERYFEIESLASHESFRIMEDFAGSLPNSFRMKSRLLDALTRRKPFRRFKDVLNSDLALRDRWFAFQQE